ncbi:hypothetical protein N7535_003068 [Penicillium sp. DV-2018c]|nr:hypothetical protein N7461_001242 [Penicillium sp. DV-2018c]KAJ5576142.1 hypothetical protein N7535_003068 [Penicillium sp. DV-2018c]
MEQKPRVDQLERRTIPSTSYVTSARYYGVPTDGSSNMVEDVLACETDEELRQLVKSVRTGLVILMRAHGGKTPTEATPSTHSGVEDSIETLKGLNIEPIIRNPQLQLRRHCLERDGNQCLETGYYSFDHDHPPKALTTHLEAAHIIP